MNPLLQIKNLTAGFQSEAGIVNALNDISFSINKGEIMALVGESGSGKSVTSLSILQLIPSPPINYKKGQILFSDNGAEPIDMLRINAEQIRTIRGNKIGMIFQEPMTSLNPTITCGEQVMEALQLHKKIGVQEAKRQTIEWFKKVKLPNPEAIYGRYPHQLSGGQKQRVMIAMAICCEPQLLICDEPTTALDVTVQKTILELIKELQAQTGMGVIFITHDLGVVAEIADRAIVMYRGTIVEQNTVKEIFSHPQHPYTKALLACRPSNHEKGKRLPTVSDFLESSETKNHAPILSQKENSNKILLDVKNLTVKFPTKKNIFGSATQYFTAVNNVSFSIYEGETLGLVGESGCGKTTLGRTLLGLIKATSGEIHYGSNNIAKMNKKSLRPLRKDLQIVFQDPYSSLNPKLSIGSAISETLKVHQLASSNTERKEKTIELLEKVGLQGSHFNRYPHEFSGGQRQRIVIARALALNPSFLICDESVSALDVSVQAQVLNLLNDLKKEFGFTVVFISHDLSVVKYISDRILVMQKGEIVESGQAEQVYNHPSSPYTQQLIASIPKAAVFN